MGLAAAIREATPYLMPGLLPAAFIAAAQGRKLLGLATFILPALLVSGLTLADHYRRSGHAVLSTSRQIVMVQALLSLVSRGVPVFEGETLIARTARETVVGIYYFSIAALNIRLFEVGHDGTGNRRGRIGQLCVGLASESG